MAAPQTDDRYLKKEKYSLMENPKKLLKQNTVIGLRDFISRNPRTSIFGEQKKGVFNIAIIGGSGVGKSALMVRLLTGSYSFSYFMLLRGLSL